MAKKAENTNMVERFDEFKEYKHIDKATMISVLEESFRNVLAKMFGTDENLDVIMNPDKASFTFNDSIYSISPPRIFIAFLASSNSSL